MRSDETLLLDIRLASRRIVTFMGGISREDFRANALVQSAVLRELTVIGEAVRVLSQDMRTRLSGVDWPGIRAMRNALVHEYFAVDLDVVWETVKEDIPHLIRQIEALIPPDDDEETLS